MNIMKIKSLNFINSPHISEKSTAANELSNKFVFKARYDATKAIVRNAIEAAFGVEVQSVNLVTVKPKTRRFGSKIGRTKKYKKAYVTLKKGQDINFSEIKI